jgi:hypothetical protein
MKTFFPLLLAVVSQLSIPGHLFLHLNAGYEVIIDGTSYGLTSDDVGGKIVDLNPGRHHVVVRSSDGFGGAFDIDIAGGQTQDVRLSPLGLRKKLSMEGEPGSLHVTCIPSDCNIIFREKDHLTNEDTIDSVPAGRYPIVATRGSLTLHTNVDLPSGMAVTLEVNFNTRTARVVDTRRRAHHIIVADANDALAPLNVPATWKSAIHSSLPAGVTVLQASAVENGIRTSLRVPSENVGISLAQGVQQQSSAFTKVAASSAARRDASGWILDVTFYFPPQR